MSANEGEMMRQLQGNWNYQSFTAVSAAVDSSKPRPIEKRPALIAYPWTPPSIMEFTTDSAGNIVGTAKLGPLEFKLTGAVIPASGPIPAADGLTEVGPTPEGIDLVATVALTGTVYNLRGYFLAGSDHIVGTVVAITNDLGRQPPGTSGPFVLYPAASGS